MQEINNAKQESSAQSNTVTLEEIQARIKQYLKEGIGRIHCRCKEPIHPEQIRMYPHAEGLEMKGKGRQWVYIHKRKTELEMLSFIPL